MIRTRLTTILAALALAVAALALTACGGDDEAGPTTVETGTPGPALTAEIILDWFPNADHAGLIAARERGFFGDQNLTITTSVPSDPAAALKQVAAGKAAFAVSYEADVLLARSQGIPVVAVGAIIGEPLNSVMARTDRGITRPRDLEGKTVGVAGVPSDRPLLDAVVRSDGGDPAKVATRNVGYSLSPALAAGKVDAVIGAYWNIEQPELEAKGVDITVLRLQEHGVPSYDELVLVTSDTVRDVNPDLIRRTLAGLAEGQRWAAENTDEAAALVAAANRDLNADTLKEQMRLTGPLLAPADAAPLTVDRGEWSAFAAWMRDNDILTKDVNVQDAVTAEYLPRS